MKTLKLTDEVVEGAEAGRSRTVEYQDEEMPGLVLRVDPGGTTLRCLLKGFMRFNPATGSVPIDGHIRKGLMEGSRIKYAN